MTPSKAGGFAANPAMLTRCGVLDTTMILNAPQITHKTRYTKTLGRTSINHEETPRETMTATAMQAMCTNRQPSYKTAESRYTPDHTGQQLTTPDETNQKPNLAIAARWTGKRTSLPVISVQSGKDHPEAELCPGIALTSKANQRIGIISLYAFFFCPIFPRCSKTQSAICANNPYSVSTRIVIN